MSGYGGGGNWQQDEKPIEVILKEQAWKAGKSMAAWLKDYSTAVRHGQWTPYTPLERKVREATRDEPWGPTGPQIQKLAEESYSRDNVAVMAQILETRFAYRFGRLNRWRCIYKSLTLLENLTKRGSEHCVALANSFIDILEDLQQVEYIDEAGKDQGISIRMRAKAIVALLEDEHHLRAERQKFQSEANKYKGYSRDDMASNSYTSYSRSSGGGFGNTDNDYNPHAQRNQYGDAHHRSRSHEGHMSSQPAGSQAGEMKGVTLKDNETHIEALREILRLPENATCADCACSSTAARPTWASINTGNFICMKCAGIHRGLGVHISQVRSTTLDTWRREQVNFMARTGNYVATQYWEAHLPPGFVRPGYGTHELESFIRAKYVARTWAKRGQLTPRADVQVPFPEPAGERLHAPDPAPSPRSHARHASANPPRARSPPRAPKGDGLVNAVAAALADPPANAPRAACATHARSSPAPHTHTHTCAGADAAAAPQGGHDDKRVSEAHAHAPPAPVEFDLLGDDGPTGPVAGAAPPMADAAGDDPFAIEARMDHAPASDTATRVTTLTGEGEEMFAVEAKGTRASLDGQAAAAPPPMMNMMDMDLAVPSTQADSELGPALWEMPGAATALPDQDTSAAAPNQDAAAGQTPLELLEAPAPKLRGSPQVPTNLPPEQLQIVLVPEPGQASPKRVVPLKEANARGMDLGELFLQECDNLALSDKKSAPRGPALRSGMGGGMAGGAAAPRPFSMGEAMMPSNAASATQSSAPSTPSGPPPPAL